MDRMVTKEKIKQMSQELEEELQWFSKVLSYRFKHYLGQELDEEISGIEGIQAPERNQSTTNFGKWIQQHQPSWMERVAIALCLAVELRPDLLDIFFIKNANYDRAFSEFGGYVPTGQSPFFPTVESLLFLLAGSDLEKRLQALQTLSPEAVLQKGNILKFRPLSSSSRWESNMVELSPEKKSEWILGHPYRPDFSATFPANRLTTSRSENDLVLSKSTLRKLEGIQNWMSHEEKLMNQWKMRGRLRPGIRALFHGPPGTGKTMAATLLGKKTGRDVYRIDLSLMISKYIGETEKNLSNVFHQAEHKDWILFFDEADALFGKRTEIKSAHDRYANQEVAYLLQRIEQFDGVVILATNFRSNLDEAFSRRFESIIHFPMPNSAQRLQLWKQSFPASGTNVPPLEKALANRLPEIAQRYSLSGGSIMNIVRFATLRTAAHDLDAIRLQDVMEGIRGEFEKEGRNLRKT